MNVPSRADAERKAESLRLMANERHACVFVRTLIDRYEREVVPVDLKASSLGSPLAHLRRIRKQFGDWRLDDLGRDMMAMENWLRTLQTIPLSERKKLVALKPRFTRTGEPVNKPPADQPTRNVSKKTKRHIRSTLRILFDHAIRWNYLELQRNPVELVRVRGKCAPERELWVLTIEQYHQLLDDTLLQPHVRMIFLVAMCWGLTISEALGLRWENMDFEAGLLRLKQGSVGKQQEGMKNRFRQKSLPIHPDLARELLAFRESSPSIDGWLFGTSRHTNRPLWAGPIVKNHLAPAGERIGLPGRLTWHVFRHSYRALMDECGDIPMTVQQKLMRHASITMTEKYGNQSKVTRQLQEGNAKIVEMIIRREA